MKRSRGIRGLPLSILIACGAMAVAAPADVITLDSGAIVHGTVLKRNDETVWVDVGPDVLRFSVDDIASIEVEAPDAPVAVETGSLFHTVDNPPVLSPREQAKRIGPSVIKVAAPSGVGSGVIINAGGHAVTNAHVIQGETALRVTVWLPEADGSLKRTIIEDVEIVAVNNHLDLALLRIPPPDDVAFTFAPLESSERIEQGQVVFAIGNPLGLERTLSQGVISTTQRSFDGLTYIQTDTAINPGNSGGPLFNTKGEVVGITNMKLSGFFAEALGFAIPARYVRDFIRNREAFAFDKDNPNSGHKYHAPPPRTEFGLAPQLREEGEGRGTGRGD
ncbi:MAG: trypsin-like peptidase domain-containing protein [Planctomycetota bacterium]|nr:trypsin-like peptidase domain-containing protein [Planctomycetota bacterium]